LVVYSHRFFDVIANDFWMGQLSGCNKNIFIPEIILTFIIRKIISGCGDEWEKVFDTLWSMENDAEMMKGPI